jgi:hypothetical protein
MAVELKTWIDEKIASVKQRIGRAAIAEVQQNLTEQYKSDLALIESTMEQKDLAAGYRRLTARRSESLNPVDQDRVLRMTRYLYYNNPIARRLVEIPVDFGYHVEIKAEETADKALQEVIDDFWLDPYNRMPIFYPQILEHFDLSGELLLPALTNPQDGKVRVKFEEPANIKTLEALADDIRYVDVIEMKGKGAERGKRYQVIRYVIDPTVNITIGEAELGNAKEVSAYGFRVGDCFYFRQCHLITGRGRPPMEPEIDWIDAHDQTAFDQLRNIALQSAFAYVCKLVGATPVQIAAKEAELQVKGPPKPGSVLVTGDSEEWDTVSPDINPSVYTDILVQVRKLIGLGQGYAETWMAASDDVNRSTAETADGPPHRHLERRQDTAQWIIRDMVDFAIDQAILHGRLRIDANDKAARAFNVQMPDLASDDNRTTAEALKIIAEAVALAVDGELCDLETARTLFYQIAGVAQPLNLDENIAKQKDAQAQEDYNKIPPLGDYLKGIQSPKTTKGQNDESRTSRSKQDQDKS